MKQFKQKFLDNFEKLDYGFLDQTFKTILLVALFSLNLAIGSLTYNSVQTESVYAYEDASWLDQDVDSIDSVNEPVNVQKTDQNSQIEPIEETKNLPEAGPAEMALTTLGLILITMSVVYWYRSEMMLKSSYQVESE